MRVLMRCRVGADGSVLQKPDMQWPKSGFSRPKYHFRVAVLQSVNAGTSKHHSTSRVNVVASRISKGVDFISCKLRSQGYPSEAESHRAKSHERKRLAKQSLETMSACSKRRIGIEIVVIRE